MLNKNKILDEIEQNECLDLFNFANTSSWIFVKDYIYRMLTNKEYSSHKYSCKTHLGYKGLFLLMLSLVNFICNIFRFRKLTLYIGAGSGIVTSENKNFYDIYLAKVKIEQMIYFINADSVDKLYERRGYIWRNKIVVTSLLFTPLRNIIKMFLLYFCYRKRDGFRDFCVLLQKYDLQINHKELLCYHLKFIAGYYLYTAILFFFRLKNAYVVSAYEKADAVAACIAEKIIVFEIQHGMIGKLHRGYNYKCNATICIPSPNCVIVDNPFWKDELIDAGYFKNNQVLLCDNFEEYHVKNINELSIEKFIVFTGQNIINDDVVAFLKEANDYLNEYGILLYYLPHPTELKEDLDRLKKQLISCRNVQIFVNKKYTTNEYIYYSLAHISLFSSCHFDSYFLKGRSFVLDIFPDNIFEYYIEKYPQSFFSVKHVKDVFQFINTC